MAPVWDRLDNSTEFFFYQTFEILNNMNINKKKKSPKYAFLSGNRWNHRHGYVHITPSPGRVRTGVL
jgi:hypothetical protein